MKILVCGDNFQSKIIISEKCCKITPNYLLIVPPSNKRVIGKFGPSEFGSGEFGLKYRC